MQLPSLKCCATASFCPGVGLRVSVSTPISFRPRSGGGVRGEVVGFSRASARRFRDLLFRYECLRGNCYSVTLTIRNALSPIVWRRNCDVYFRRLVRRGDCGFWRVELQRRGTPHLHCLFWSSNVGLLRSDWLDVWGVSSDPDHVKHACLIEESGNSAWLGYMAAHAVKHKKDQLGWKGRQWGVVGRKFLSLRPMSVVDVPLDELSLAVDEFNKYLDYSCLWSGLPSIASWTRFCSQSVMDEFTSCLNYAHEKILYDMALHESVIAVS